MPRACSFFRRRVPRSGPNHAIRELPASKPGFGCAAILRLPVFMSAGWQEIKTQALIFLERLSGATPMKLPCQSVRRNR